MVKQENRHYFVDKEGKAELTADYDEVGDFGNGLAPVRRGKKWYLIDKKGNVKVTIR